MSGNKTKEESLLEWNYYLASYQLPNIIILIIYLITGITGNAVVIYGYNYKMKGKREDRYFIPALAVIDIIACIIASGKGIYFELFPVMFGGSSWLCKLVTFANMAATTASGLMLCVIAVQRYLKVCRPFSGQMTLFWKRIALLSTIASGFVFSIPCIFFYGKIEVLNISKNLTGHACAKFPPGQELGKWAIVYVVVTSTSAILCTLSAMGLYALILRTIRKSRKMRNDLRLKRAMQLNEDTSVVDGKETETSLVRNESIREQNSSSKIRVYSKPKTTRVMSEHFSAAESPQIQKKSTLQRKDTTSSFKKSASNAKRLFLKHRYSLMFMTITGIFIIAFAPWHALTILETMNPSFWFDQSETSKIGLLFLFRIYILNHVANPFVYGLFDGAFRKVIRHHLFNCSEESRNKKVSVM